MELDLDGAGRHLTPDIEVVLYRVVQEALTNVARHAGAAAARVRRQRRARRAAGVEDDGRGAADDAKPQLGGSACASA